MKKHSFVLVLMLTSISALAAEAEGPVWVEGRIGNLAGDTVTLAMSTGDWLMPRTVLEKQLKELRPGQKVRFQIDLKEVEKLNAKK